ncbi:MAG: 30S ribosomal protein S6e [Candidatus Bathyarchaeia archaeon]
MVKFKIIISDPVEGKARNMEVEGVNAQPLIGRTVNETLDGSLLGLRGKKLRITGGVDRDGFPLRPDVHGGGKKRLILTGGVGFKARKRGERRRKTVRGSIITEDTYVINMTVLKEEQPKPEEPKGGAEGGEA